MNHERGGICVATVLLYYDLVAQYLFYGNM
jgi:hypothetical protein